VIDTAAQKEIGQIPVGKGPAQVGFTPDGRLAFVSLSQDNSVAIIDPLTRQVLRKLPVGQGPIQLYATPDSRLLLVANQGTPGTPGQSLSVIDLISLQRDAADIPTGKGPHGVVIAPDGQRAYVTNQYENTVSVIDVPARKPVATIAVGDRPNGISITP
jgi:YVTN family beta-propeller protein